MIGAVVVLRDDRQPLGYVVQESGCWEWVGAIKPNGYGTVWVNGHLEQAHRYVYSLCRGAIPVGLTLDHLCRNRSCVRPDHLEAVTLRENHSRSALCNAGKTHCKRGHAFTAENTYYRANNTRLCRACARIADGNRRSRRKP